MELPSSDKTNLVQKGLAIIILGAVLYGAVLLLNQVLPPITQLFRNIWMLLLYGVPLLLVGLYIVSNPLLIWGFFKTLSYKLTSFLVKMDPLSVMDRYVEYLKKKLQNLGETITILAGKKVKLDRKIQELNARIKENVSKGKAARKINTDSSMQQAALYGVKIGTDTNTLTMLIPIQERADKSLKFLNALSENWKFGIEKLEYQIEGKRAEYEIIKETTKGLKSADALINSDNEAAKLYGMSVKSLEESASQQIGYIEEFEKRSKGIMDNIEIEKQSIKDEGLAVLEQYMNDENLKLNFSTQGIQDISYETIPSQSTLKTTPKFKFLGNKN